MTIQPYDRIRITGRVVSQQGKPAVENVEGVVATITETEVKVWPAKPIYDGKLWFVIADSQIELIERDPDMAEAAGIAPPHAQR